MLVVASVRVGRGELSLAGFATWGIEDVSNMFGMVPDGVLLVVLPALPSAVDAGDAAGAF